MKNTIKYSAITLLLCLFANSCTNYLEPELGDQMTLEEAFSKRVTTERYLAHVYSFLPNDYHAIATWGFDRITSAVARSDESYFSWTSGTPYLSSNNGSWNPTTSAFHTWSFYYKGIHQATTFIKHVDMCKELSADKIKTMKAEVRFLRAFYYFMLVQQYGPVYLWGDQILDADLTVYKGEDIDRHPLDECINFISAEFDEAANVLGERIEDPAWEGRVTKGAVLAAKSRLWLYASRPLFNGCEWYKSMKNYYGDYLFPQSYDPGKWKKAADAAKAVIDLGIYSLYEDKTETDPFKKAIKSYQGIYFEKWNSELIWARWQGSGFDWNVRSAPSVVLKEGYSGYAPSLKLVDTYPMASSGRFPIKGYLDNGDPIIDATSGYLENGFSGSYVHPIDGFTINAHNSCVGRDARFYSSILFSGMYWINTFNGKKLVTFHKSGTSPYGVGADFVKVGYLFRRMSDPRNDTEASKWGSFSWPYFRLGEVYLNYAEACNEMENRDETNGLLYWNKVRARSGLNKIEEAYPEIMGNKSLYRELLQKERMVELAFENHRYYDIRLWMIAEQESNGKRYGRNLLSDTYEGSWTRTSSICQPIVCLPKHHLFPIHQDQLNEMKNITQNYGW